MTKSAAIILLLAIVLAIMAAIGWMFAEYGASFAGGFLCATIFWEVAHRLSKGYWFTG